MAFAHIGVHADHIHYRTKPREDYNVGGIGWLAGGSETPKDAVERCARDLATGESVIFPYRKETLRDLISLSEAVVVTSDDPRLLKKVFGRYEKLKDSDPQAYFTVVEKESPWGAGVALKSKRPHSHESLLHQLVARLLGYPTTWRHQEPSEPAAPQTAGPSVEFERRHVGGNTFIWEPAQPKK